MRRTTFSFYNRKISSRRRSTRTFISASNYKPAVVILPGLGNATEDYEEFKEELSELLVDKIIPISEEIKKLLQDESYLDSILLDGVEKAEKIASEKIKNIKEIVGF